MNQEAQFALRFVVKDLAKIRKACDEMNERLANMDRRAKRASKSIDGVQKSFRKATVSIGKFALAYFTLSKMISTVFSKAAESIQIDMMADSAGVAAEKIGKLGKALRVYGGDAKTAGSAYMNLTNIIGGATHGRGLSEDITRVNAMYGIGFNYGNISQDQLMTNIAVAMQKLRNKGDQWGINQIASAYGIDTSMANFLSEQGANWSSTANKEKWEKLSRSETRQLIEAEEALKEEYAKLTSNFLPDLVKGLEKLNQFLDDINKFLNRGQPKKTTNKKGETVYETPTGLFSDEKLQMNFNNLNKNKGSAPRVVSVPFGKDAMDNIQRVNDKIKQERLDFEATKAKYESVPGQTYTRNWWTGRAVLDIDLEAQVNPSSGLKVKDVKYERNVQLAPTK